MTEQCFGLSQVKALDLDAIQARLLVLQRQRKSGQVVTRPIQGAIGQRCLEPVLGQHIRQRGARRQCVCVDLDDLAVRRIDERGVARREIAEAAAVAVDHLHRRHLISGKPDNEVMNGLCVAVLFFVGKRHVDHLAGFAEAHGAGELRLKFLLNRIVPDEGRRVVAGNIEGVVQALVPPDVTGVQNRLGNVEQACRLIGMRAHPDRAADFAAVLRHERGDQVVVIELVGDRGEDG